MLPTVSPAVVADDRVSGVRIGGRGTAGPAGSDGRGPPVSVSDPIA